MGEAKRITLHTDINLGLTITYCPTYVGYTLKLSDGAPGNITSEVFPSREEYIKYTITVSDSEIYFTKAGIIYMFNYIEGNGHVPAVDTAMFLSLLNIEKLPHQNERGKDETET